MTHRVRPKGSATRTVVAGGRRTVAGRPSAPQVNLDDHPLALAVSRDGKRVLVTLPYDVWIVSAQTLEVERTIPLDSPRPSVFEGDEGVLWIGGQHLYRSTLVSTTATKHGSKLGGFVDHVCQARARMLCGAGSQGEVLWDVAKEEVVHRRKVAEHAVVALVPAADGRVVWAAGEPHAWVIDPDHPSGYTKLKLKHTSAVEVPAEAIVALGSTTEGGCVLAARDGAVAWTNRGLRLVGERHPRAEGGGTRPLAVACDAQHAYVLRPAGVLHRFLLAPPKAEPAHGKDGPAAGGKKPAAKGLRPEPEPEAPPEAEQCRLRRLATCIAIGDDGQLVLAGPHADGELGRLWREDPAGLEWEPLPLGARTLVEPPPAPPEGEAKVVPSFIPTRSKPTGEPITAIKVDDVLAGSPGLWVTRHSGTLLERPAMPVAVADVLPGDAVILPAMVRLHEGTARPALVLWPGTADDEREVGEPQWLVWGDRPRGWMPLRTPEVRAQGWSRRDVFPLQIALPRDPPALPGHRASLSSRWVDGELFTALGRECKKLLKVLW